MSEFGKGPPDSLITHNGKVIGGVWNNPLAYYDDGAPRYFSLMKYKMDRCTAIDGRDPGDEE